MKNKMLVAIPLGLIACYGASQVTAQVECELVDVPPVCQGGQQININTNSKIISPSNLCAVPGETIEVNVTPAGSTASIGGKDGGWPSASGSTFTITAPAEGSYDYNVFFADGSCIDPRITVRK